MYRGHAIGSAPPRFARASRTSRARSSSRPSSQAALDVANAPHEDLCAYRVGWLIHFLACATDVSLGLTFVPPSRADLPRAGCPDKELSTDDVVLILSFKAHFYNSFSELCRAQLRVDILADMAAACARLLNQVEQAVLNGVACSSEAAATERGVCPAT